MAIEKLGIADVRVKLYSSAPYLARVNKKYNFDISAHNWQVIQNSPFVKPLLTEYIEDSEGTMAALHPSKRKLYIDNILGVPTAESSGKILWNQLSEPPLGLPKNIVTNGKYDSYTLLPLRNYNIPSDYKGPVWWDNAIGMQPPPDDRKTILAFFDLMDATNDANDIVTEENTTTTTTTETNENRWPKNNVIHQSCKRDGLWWAIESNEFLQENTPFWVNFRKMEAPSSATHETCFVIRLGPTNDLNKYDIYLSFNNRPQLIDYIGSNGEPGGGAGGGAHIFNQQEWKNDLARVMSHASDIEVGIMTVAGRLVIIVNNIPMVYTRINRESGEDGGKLLECKIPPGKIQIFGTNVETRILVCPMVFADLSICALPLPTIMDDRGGSSHTETVEVVYKGSDWQGNPRGSVAEIPSPPSSNEKLFGVDCNSFSAGRVFCHPYGMGFHKQGNIIFEKASASTFNALPSTDFYILCMKPSSNTTIAGINILNGGCPYFFKLKGIYSNVQEGIILGNDISEYLISVDETAQAPDYFHAQKNASLTFYNPNNVIGNMVTEKQTAIDITWKWSEAQEGKKTFTGIVTSLSKSDIPGKETVTLNCDDYIYVLKSVPIINSPFYDGMVAYYAIKDLAERAGVTTFVKDWENEQEYFLPAGFSFSQPKMRFDTQQMILDCITNIVQRNEAFVFFDGDGRFHIAKLPGGLFSVTHPGSETGTFTSNMLSGGARNTILEERSVDIGFESTVNSITILTLDRDTRNAIIYSHVPGAGEDKLAFLKPMVRKEPALGELEVAKAWAHDLGKRVFYPILKTRFKTTGITDIVFPLDFIIVDGHMFRVMSVKRSFVADTNDMNCSYECEWLGGR